MAGRWVSAAVANCRTVTDKTKKAGAHECSGGAGRKIGRSARNGARCWPTTRSSQGRLAMLRPSTIGAIFRTFNIPTVTVGMMALAFAATAALAFDEAQYPDWSGQWHRPRGVGI